MHVINAVLPLVAANDGGTGGGGGEEEYETDATIVELLQSAELQETFSTLRAAVEKFPDVVTLLSAADGSVYSVFAPVNSVRSVLAC